MHRSSHSKTSDPFGHRCTTELASVLFDAEKYPTAHVTSACRQRTGSCLANGTHPDDAELHAKIELRRERISFVVLVSIGRNSSLDGIDWSTQPIDVVLTYLISILSLHFIDMLYLLFRKHIVNYAFTTRPLIRSRFTLVHADRLLADTHTCVSRPSLPSIHE